MAIYFCIISSTNYFIQKQIYLIKKTEVIMKALKVVLVAALVTITMMGMAQQPDRVKPVFNSAMIPITSIEATSGFGNSVMMQVDAKSLLLSSENSHIIIATVRYDGKIYKIYGTYYQWVRFLKVNPKPMPFEEAVKEGKKIE
jgi:hypothetical protein